MRNVRTMVITLLVQILIMAHSPLAGDFSSYYQREQIAVLSPHVCISKEQFLKAFLSDSLKEKARIKREDIFVNNTGLFDPEAFGDETAKKRSASGAHDENISEAARLDSITVDKGKKRRRNKLIKYTDQGKEKLYNALEKKNGMVTRAADELGIDKKRIYKTIPKEKINALRSAAKKKKETIERQRIIDAIRFFAREKDCLRQAAGYLGICLRTLHSKLKKYEIPWQKVRYEREKILQILREENGKIIPASKRMNLHRNTFSAFFPKEIAQVHREITERYLTEMSFKINEALEETGGDRTLAAKKLHIAPRTFFKWQKIIITNELREIDKLLGDLRIKISKADRNDTEALRYFYGINALNLFYGQETLVEEAKRKIKNSKMRKLDCLLKIYQKTVCTLKKKILDIDRSRHSKMVHTLDELAKIIEKHNENVKLFFAGAPAKSRNALSVHSESVIEQAI